ncbi:MAG: Calx-beta domain-containing protein [Planctomycetota bacterium]|jgi:hypothetical protein
MKAKIAICAVAAICAFVTVPAGATLTVIGTATYDGNDYNLVWDDDNGAGTEVVYLDYDDSNGPFVGDLDNAECPDAYTLMDAWPAPAFNRFWVGMSATGHIYQQPGSCGSGGSILQHDNPNDYDNGAFAVRSAIEVLTGVPTIKFESADSGDLESVTPAELTVLLVDPEEGQTYTVDYAVTGGSATGCGVDYHSQFSPCNLPDLRALAQNWLWAGPGFNRADLVASGKVDLFDFSSLAGQYLVEKGTLVFGPGQTSKTININIMSGDEEEWNETIEVTLFNPAGPEVRLGQITQHTYTIIDPSPSVEFDQAGGSGMEAVTPVYVSVSLSAPATETITVDYDVIGGTATGGGVDYTLGPGTLTFDIDDVTKDIVIDIVSDANDQEPAETIIIELSNPAGAKLGAQAQYTYTIRSLIPHLKVDFAQVYCPDSNTIRAETAKPGWWHWATGRWADMYAHDCAWACEQFPCPGGIDGTGITAAVTLILEGDLGMKVAGLTGALGGGVCPTGSPIYEPICNSWLQCIDWPEFEWGSIQLVFHDLPAGEYELYSYHNHFGCYREDEHEYTPVSCDCLCDPAPPMPEIRAMSCKEARELPYQAADPWSKLFPGIDWTTGPWPEGVTSIQEAYNVQPQQVTTDAELVPSLIKFSTDGSPVLILYKAGCCEPDPVRPTRVGGRAILNAFEIRKTN